MKYSFNTKLHKNLRGGALSSLIISCIAILILCAVFGLSFAQFIKNPSNPVNAFTSVSSSNAVTVPQLWNSSTRSFNRDAMSTLLKYISSDGSVNGVNTTQQTAADIRGYTYNGKTNSQAVVVTLGDYQWQVVYLTRTNDTSGDRIATLLMVNNDGEARYGSSSYYGTNDFTNGYPTSMYGTSHIRAVTLNNGGPYVKIANNNSNPTSVTQATQDSSHKYALFTVDSLGLTNYLVQPKNVWYQTQAQLTGGANLAGYTLNNESLATNLSGYYDNNTYQTKTYYTQWGNDHLWLPSLSETGTSNSELGIWELSTTERSASNEWWSRSGCYNDSYSAYFLYPSGSISRIGMVHTSYGVRPSLHLNLDSALNNLTNDIIVESNDSTQGTVSGGGVYDFEYTGTTTITALANYGYVFDYWQDSSGNKIYQNPYTFPVTKSETYTAYFRLPQVTFTTSNSGAEIAINNTTTDDIVRRHQLDFTADNYLDSVSINGGPPQDIEYLSGTLIADDTCLGITYLTNASASRVLFEVSGVIDDVEITLYFTNIEQTLSPPSASGGANGIVVSATAGGVASIVGDDFENLGDNDTITFIARLAQNGYRFSHWEDDEGNNLGTTDNLVLTKAEAYNKKITAVFVPLDQSNANFDTNNDDTQEFY